MDFHASRCSQEHSELHNIRTTFLEFNRVCCRDISSDLVNLVRFRNKINCWTTFCFDSVLNPFYRASLSLKITLFLEPQQFLLTFSCFYIRVRPLLLQEPTEQSSAVSEVEEYEPGPR